MGKPNLTGKKFFKVTNEKPDEKELEEISEEVSGEIDRKTFYKVYNEAIREPFDFLLIDLHKKENHPSMFRRNFNEYIII